MAQSIGRPGDRYGDYTLVDVLGAGGNATVWRASGPSGDVAVKVLRQQRHESEPFRRFAREVDMLRQVSDIRGVLPILDAFLPDGRPGKRVHRAWIAMPLARPVRDVLPKEPNADQVVAAVTAYACTLRSLADRGITHRDIKPENLYQRNGVFEIGDFGLAALVLASDERLTAPGRVLGPRHYIAPELIQDPVNADGRSADVYSLGKVLWVLLTGQAFPPPGAHRLDEPTMLVRNYLETAGVARIDAVMAAMTRHDPSERLGLTAVIAELEAWGGVQPEDPARPNDLGDVRRRLIAAGAPVRARQDEAATRDASVFGAMVKFSTIATGLAETLEENGFNLFRGLESGWGMFRTDAAPHFLAVEGGR